MLVYDEPCPGLDEAGNEVTCNRQVHVTNEDAIKMQRYVFKLLLKKRGSVYTATSISPKHLLEEYVVVNWASEYK